MRDEDGVAGSRHLDKGNTEAFFSKDKYKFLKQMKNS